MDLVTLRVKLPACACTQTCARNRHDRGWPKFQLLTFVTITDQSWRYCIEPMGYRDTVWERSGYVELIRWTNTYSGPSVGGYSELSEPKSDGIEPDTVLVTNGK